MEQVFSILLALNPGIWLFSEPMSLHTPIVINYSVGIRAERVHDDLVFTGYYSMCVCMQITAAK